MEIAASDQIKNYFKDIRSEVEKCYEIAKSSKKIKLDPADQSEIILANTMADRVLGLISMVSPQILKTNIPKRIQQLEKEYGNLDWRVGFKIAEEVAKEKFCKFKSKKEAIEVGIRTGFAYLTLGIVAAPLEGFIGIEIKNRKDGKEYIALKYAGPIRGAGGTASSTSVILADYVRVKMGYSTYDPSEKEIKRYISEIHDYHERVTNLQYHPSDEELEFMISHLPIEVDGDPTEKIEVSNFKDLPRINTNLIRGGVALVVAEGLCQKAPKLWKRLGKWGKDFDLEWDFISEFIDLKKKIHSKKGDKSLEDGGDDFEDKIKKAKANDTFIADIVAGRPVLTHPITAGGFRLRYGRTRGSGFSATALNPATMVVLDDFIAVGSQMKVERPGKAATATLCHTIEGPIVRLKNGDVLKLDTEQEAKSVNKNIEEILFLGDILFNYGDFSENGHVLVPAGYCSEWWALEVERELRKFISDEEICTKEILDKNELINAFKKSEIDCNTKGITDYDRLSNFILNHWYDKPSFEEAIKISEKLNVPIHPEYTAYWSLLSVKELKELCELIFSEKIIENNNFLEKLIFQIGDQKDKATRFKFLIEKIGLIHKIINNESIVVSGDEIKQLGFFLNFSNQEELNEVISKNGFDKNVILRNYNSSLDYLNSINKIQLRDKAGTFIGARMGRPEKAKMRSMTGKPHVMFPVGEEGGRLRCFQSALEKGFVRSSFSNFFCVGCHKESIYRKCILCNRETEQKYNCRFCGDLDKDGCKHGKGKTNKFIELDIKKYFLNAKELLGERIHPDLIKGIKKSTNKNKVVEHLAKGILRAKHLIYVNKDGTTRFDCTELPITHFKPKEIGTSIEKLKELGYNKDHEGNYLIDGDQVVELFPQDIILPGKDFLEESAFKVLKRVSNYVDDLLLNFYGQEPYYNIKSGEDLVGHLIIGLAPHISAGTVGRIIGFSQTQSLLAHPMYHAALRRDCDGDEAAVMLLLDGLLNFSKQYLPSSRGSTMDAPLVLTPIIFPSEVDDQVLGIEMEERYPLEFYESSLEMKAPWDVKFGKNKRKLIQLNDYLDTKKQYQGFKFTHHIENFNKGPLCSAYKILPSMREKLLGQMDIAKKVKAVQTGDVARMVIQKHFLSDIKGNFKKFSMQGFRCGKCNTKYRRPPIDNKCHTCKVGKIIFTISEGSIKKYIGLSMELSDEYEFSPYLKEVMLMLKDNLDVVFGKEKDKQVGLASFM